MIETFRFRGKSNSGVFFFKGKPYQYYNHTYNAVGLNERTIEIPIINGYFEKYRGKDVLEIGHTLGHYLTKYDHDIVDKCEEAPGVTNVDIVDFEPTKKYDLIFSISTMEHVGNDEAFEESPDKDKVKVAFDRCVSWLKPDGAFICTFPLGFNYHLDTRVMNGEIKFDELYCFGRESSTINHWIFTSFETAYKSDLKVMRTSIKDINGVLQPFTICFFVAIGIIYGGNNDREE
jgi:hypothetical protein